MSSRNQSAKASEKQDKAEGKRLNERKSLLAAVSKADVSSRMCGICGVNYNHPNQGTPLLVINVKDWELDLGGYCARCRLYLCSKHVQLVPHGTVEVFGTVHDVYARQCVTCQMTLTDQEGDDPDAPPPSMFLEIRIS